jgi:UPF0755 protein
VSVIAILTASILALGWLTIVYPEQRGTGSGRVVEVAISKGSSARVVAENLHEKGVVSRPEIFALYVRVIGADRKLNSGRVLLQDSMRVREIVQRLASGFGYAQLRVTIPEGYTRFDIAESLQRWGICQREDFIEATEDATILKQFKIAQASAEGYLFPDTYELKDGLDAKTVLARLVTNFRRRMHSLSRQYPHALSRLKEEMGWQLHQVVILASIVEKEAADPAEQPIIAGVFFNRLRRPEFPLRRLQADPTIVYGCRIAPESSSACTQFNGKDITRAMIQDENNPYNTYRLEGLPPGPISNPGLDALRAVLKPTEHDFFYFVVSTAGRHRFSKTVTGHNRAVRAYRTVESGRQ